MKFQELSPPKAGTLPTHATSLLPRGDKDVEFSKIHQDEARQNKKRLFLGGAILALHLEQPGRWDWTDDRHQAVTLASKLLSLFL